MNKNTHTHIYIYIYGPLVSRNQIYGRNVHQGRGQLSRSLLSDPPGDFELE